MCGHVPTDVDCQASSVQEHCSIAHACTLSLSLRGLDFLCIRMTHDRTLTPVAAAPEGSCLPACCRVMRHIDVHLLRYADAQAVFAHMFTLPLMGSSHHNAGFSASPFVYTAKLTVCMPITSSG